MSIESVKKSILVVDDEPANIDLLVGMLQQRFIVKAARSGQLALKISRLPEPPDLILLDVMMPEMDGYEVCRRLKGDPVTVSIPVIFLSGEEDIRASEHGAVGALHKPVDAERLTAAIERAWSYKGGA